jgi:tripartite-type tricarboxylate transporter receptor subunit TctC
LLVMAGSYMAGAAVQKKLSFDVRSAYAPVTKLTTVAYMLMVTASLPVNSVAELVAYGKSRPNTLSYGSAGVGSAGHLAGALFSSMAGIQMVHVPYKGGAPLATNLVGGQIPLGLMPLSTMAQQVRTGKVKILAVLSPKRYPGMPEVPTVSEAVPGFARLEGSGPWAFGPAGMSQPVLARIYGAIVKALNAPEVRDKLEAGGLQVVGNSPAEFAAQIQSVAELGAKLMKVAGIEPE